MTSQMPRQTETLLSQYEWSEPVMLGKLKISFQENTRISSFTEKPGQNRLIHTSYLSPVVCIYSGTLPSHLSSLVPHIRETSEESIKCPRREMTQVAWGHELCVLWASGLNSAATVLPRKAGMWMRASWTQVPPSRPKGCKWARRKTGRWAFENEAGSVLSQSSSKYWILPSSKCAKYPKEQATHF